MDGSPPRPVRPLHVDGDGGPWIFKAPFEVGRSPDCAVRFEGHPRVSRVHLRVFPEGGTWWVQDQGSANGLLVRGERVARAEIDGATDVQVGEGGPRLTLTSGAGPPAPALTATGDGATDDSDETRAFVPLRAGAFAGSEAPAGPSAPRPGSTPPGTPPPGSDGTPLSYEHVVKRYFSEDDAGEDAGERTRFIRQAYVDIKKASDKEHHARQSRTRTLLVAALAVCVVAVSYAGYREYTIRQLRTQAQQLFTQLQTYNVTVAQQVVAVEAEIEARPEAADSLRASLDDVLAVRQQTAARYDQFVRGLGVYDGLSSEEEAIYRVARAFGESELTIPPAFVDEVKVYVAKWKNSNRFQTAVRTAQVNGYIPATVDALRRNGMPPEFFYLALQESNFDTRIVGPPTRYGYAKGAWQFIPETGQRYGLTPGPLVGQPVYDPQDERQDFDAAVEGAASYLHDIYTTLSQASGLLVCASYNWGEHRVKQKMKGIANDPEHRTYWRFLTEYRDRMPDETKGYVMNIFAAAVIGQNPRMFGIDMDPPLEVALAGGGGIVRDRRAGDPSRPAARLGGSALERRQTPARPTPSPARP